MDQLEHALRAAEVLEPELAEVAQAGAGREAIGAERGGGRRQQDLAAVTDGHETGGAVDRRAEVVGAAPLGVAGMERHPDVERAGLTPVGGGQGALGGEARDDALVRGGKDGHHPVAGRLDHDAIGRFDRLAEDHVMPRQGVGHRGRQVLPEPGAPGDVGEQEGQRAGPDDRGGGFACVGSVHGSTIRRSDVKSGAGSLRLRLGPGTRRRGESPRPRLVWWRRAESAPRRLRLRAWDRSVGGRPIQG